MTVMQQPGPDLWQSWGEAGEEAVRAPILALAMALNELHPAAPIAAGMGALAAVAQMLSVTCDPSGRPYLEEQVIAFIRGCIRGVDGPIHEDGRPWEGTHHA